MSMGGNTPSMLMIYFDLNLRDFQNFWKSLTVEEKDYFRNTPLV